MYEALLESIYATTLSLIQCQNREYAKFDIFEVSAVSEYCGCKDFCNDVAYTYNHSIRDYFQDYIIYSFKGTNVPIFTSGMKFKGREVQLKFRLVPFTTSWRPLRWLQTVWCQIVVGGELLFLEVCEYFFWNRIHWT